MKALLSRHRRLLAALFAAAAATAGLAAARPHTGGVRVLVAARDLAAGTTLRPGDLAVRTLPRPAVPDGVVSRAAGRTLSGPVRRGEPLTDVRLRARRFLDTIPSGGPAGGASAAPGGCSGGTATPGAPGGSPTPADPGTTGGRPTGGPGTTGRPGTTDGPETTDGPDTTGGPGNADGPGNPDGPGNAGRPGTLGSGDSEGPAAEGGRETSGPADCSGEPGAAGQSGAAGDLGDVAAPVRLADAAVAGLLRPGDLVDVLAARAEGPPSARTIAAGVPVVAVPRPGPDATEGALVVLRTNREQSAALARAAVDSRLTVTIVG